MIMGARSWLERLAGHFGEARQLAERAIDSFLALGMRITAAGYHLYLAEIELLDGSAEAALALLLRGDAILAEASEYAVRATIQALLARVYERLGDRDLARAAIALSDELGPTEDVVNYAITHAVRARLALAGGDVEAGERWARSAVEHAFRTDFVKYRGETQLELARILAALGRHEEARSPAQAALELYEAKGDRPGTVEARALLATLGVRA
jgi:tetratricopeptide (TPR) repeat protein